MVRAAANSSSVTSPVRSRPLGKLADAGLIDVEANDGEVPRHIDGKRQPDIAKPDDADAHVLERGGLRLPGSRSRAAVLKLVVHGQVLSSLNIGLRGLAFRRSFSQSSGELAGERREFVLGPPKMLRPRAEKMAGAARA